LQALCRQLARTRLREDIQGPTTPEHIDRAIEQYLDLPKLTAHEELVVATHEAGHAVVSLACKHASPIDRISIRGDIGGALGYVQHSDPAHKYVVTYAQLRDSIATLFGGREAECLLLDDVSIGAASDLQHATAIARALVEEYGDGGEDLGVARWTHHDKRPVSEMHRAHADKAVKAILDRERQRAKDLLAKHKPMLVALRDLLLDKKVLDRASFAHLALTPETAAAVASVTEVPHG
jgi:cell division protease FtsH